MYAHGPRAAAADTLMRTWEYVYPPRGEKLQSLQREEGNTEPEPEPLDPDGGEARVYAGGCKETAVRPARD